MAARAEGPVDLRLLSYLIGFHFSPERGGVDAQQSGCFGAVPAGVTQGGLDVIAFQILERKWCPSARGDGAGRGRYFF